ncbi:unnamed protein product [Adineta ricciae]|uniref:Secreted protein n=1 Tax=Adineta ricciae TaxID=249248 RepID=A0A815LXD3_ADIRI|nr:unnamed protein product [Adineta ricciae]CAF1598883.1 unnamed protein product [Adineta ricciae]
MSLNKCAFRCVVLVLWVTCGCLGKPIWFETLEQLNVALAGAKKSFGDGVSPNSTATPLEGHSTILRSGKGVDWLSMAINVALGTLSSGGFVCICTCGIKFIRNGGRCKSAWFRPKSLAEYKRRQLAKNDLEMVSRGNERRPVSTISSATSSSPPQAL